MQDSRFKNIVAWTVEGDSITIDSHNEFLETSLSRYFNHTKISSFIRQLNLYGFKKVSERGSQMMYRHECFVRDKPNLHVMIRRKRKNRTIIQKHDKVQQKEQNSVIEKEKTRIKGLQDIYSRIRTENQRIKNQTSQINLQRQTITQIKKSPFYEQLKRESTQIWAKIDQNNLEQTRPKSASNEQQSTPDPENITQNKYQSVGTNEYYENEQNLENGENNEMEMFREDFEELSCEKMGMGNEEEASFWKKDKMKCGVEK